MIENCIAEALGHWACGWNDMCEELGVCYLNSSQMSKDLEKAEACGCCDKESCYCCAYNENKEY